MSLKAAAAAGCRLTLKWQIAAVSAVCVELVSKNKQTVPAFAEIGTRD